MSTEETYLFIMASAFTMCLVCSYVRARNLITTNRKAKLFDLVILFNLSGLTYFAVGGFHMASHPVDKAMNMAFAVAFWLMSSVPLYVYVLRDQTNTPSP